MSTLADRIKLIRRQHNLNQKAFSSLIHLSQGRLSDIEADKTKPSFETLVSIKEQFHVSLDWLMTGEEPKPVESQRPPDDSALNVLSEEEMQILLLYRQLAVRDKIKIEGMMELKISENIGSNKDVV